LESDIDKKSGLLVSEVLQSKPPEAIIQPPQALDAYEVCPEMPNVDVSSETVEEVFKRLSCAAGSAGTNAVAVQC